MMRIDDNKGVLRVFLALLISCAGCTAEIGEPEEATGTSQEAVITWTSDISYSLTSFNYGPVICEGYNWLFDNWNPGRLKFITQGTKFIPACYYALSSSVGTSSTSSGVKALKNPSNYSYHANDGSIPSNAVWSHDRAYRVCLNIDSTVPGGLWIPGKVVETSSGLRCRFALIPPLVGQTPDAVSTANFAWVTHGDPP